MSIKSASLNRLLNIVRGSLPSLVLLYSCFLTDAGAQVSPETQAQIAAYIEQSRALAAEYDARPRPDPYVDLREQSARLTADQRAQAQALFASAFSVWRAEDYAAAELGFREGLAIDPANGSANFYLGDILRRRGNGSDAADYMARAAALAPGSAEGLRARVALNNLPAPPDPEINSPPVIFTPSGGPITFRECADCPEMVIVPGGAFTMGSPQSERNRGAYEEPQQRIVFGRAFAVGRYEVTRGQYATFTRATGRAAGDCYAMSGSSEQQRAGATWRSPGFTQGDDHPVVCVSRDDARAYVAWLNTQTLGGYRLLSEAEWEYAERAGTTSAWPWGSSPDGGCAFANIADATARAHYSSWTTSTCNDGTLYTAAVGSYQPNAFGLFDFGGNVMEWVQDCYEAPGAAADSCAYGVYRGGCWYCSVEMLRSAYRGRIVPSFRRDVIGFRVAKTL